MKMATKFRVLVCFVVVATLALPVVADARRGFKGPGHSHRKDPARMIADHAERLGLDDATLAAIDELVTTARNEREELHLELRIAHDEMRTLLSKSRVDEAQVMALADDIGAVEVELRKSYLRTLLGIRGLLTEEQLTELKLIHDERRAHHMGPVLEACAVELEQLCADAAEGRGRMRCLKEHREELSDDCRSAARSLKKRRHRRERSPSPPADGDE